MRRPLCGERVVSGRGISGRMAELAYAIALGAIGVTLGGSNPLPPIVLQV